MGIDFSKTIIRKKSQPNSGDSFASPKYQNLFEGPDDFITQVMDRLRGAEGGDKRTQILKDILSEFLIEILKDKKLPYFLEFIRQETKADLNGSKAGGTPEQVPDVFIRSLKVYLESDNEIKIKECGKKRKTINLDFLSHGQRETFIKILFDSGRYSTGKAGRKNTSTRKMYDTKQKLLKSINEKLINSFNKNVSFQIPEKYKLYELYKAGGSGFYTFKFQVKRDKEMGKSLRIQYENSTKDELLNHLFSMASEYSKKPENHLKGNINTAKQVLIEIFGMAEKEIKDFIDPSTDKEEILKGFSDHRYEKQNNLESDY